MEYVREILLKKRNREQEQFNLLQAVREPDPECATLAGRVCFKLKAPCEEMAKAAREFREAAEGDLICLNASLPALNGALSDITDLDSILNEFLICMEEVPQATVVPVRGSARERIEHLRARVGTFSTKAEHLLDCLQERDLAFRIETLSERQKLKMMYLQSEPLVTATSMCTAATESLRAISNVRQGRKMWSAVAGAAAAKTAFKKLSSEVQRSILGITAGSTGETSLVTNELKFDLAHPAQSRRGSGSIVHGSPSPTSPGSPGTAQHHPSCPKSKPASAESTNSRALRRVSLLPAECPACVRAAQATNWKTVGRALNSLAIPGSTPAQSPYGLASPRFVASPRRSPYASPRTLPPSMSPRPSAASRGKASLIAAAVMIGTNSSVKNVSRSSAALGRPLMSEESRRASGRALPASDTASSQALGGGGAKSAAGTDKGSTQGQPAGTSSPLSPPPKEPIVAPPVRRVSWVDEKKEDPPSPATPADSCPPEESLGALMFQVRHKAPERRPPPKMQRASTGIAAVEANKPKQLAPPLERAGSCAADIGSPTADTSAAAPTPSAPATAAAAATATASTPPPVASSASSQPKEDGQTKSSQSKTPAKPKKVKLDTATAVSEDDARKTAAKKTVGTPNSTGSSRARTPSSTRSPLRQFSLTHPSPVRHPLNPKKVGFGANVPASTWADDAIAAQTLGTCPSPLRWSSPVEVPPVKPVKQHARNNGVPVIGSIEWIGKNGRSQSANFKLNSDGHHTHHKEAPDDARLRLSAQSSPTHSPEVSFSPPRTFGSPVRSGTQTHVVSPPEAPLPEPRAPVSYRSPLAGALASVVSALSVAIETLEHPPVAQPGSTRPPPVIHTKLLPDPNFPASPKQGSSAHSAALRHSPKWRSRDVLCVSPESRRALVSEEPPSPRFVSKARTVAALTAQGSSSPLFPQLTSSVDPRWRADDGGGGALAQSAPPTALGGRRVRPVTPKSSTTPSSAPSTAVGGPRAANVNAQAQVHTVDIPARGNEAPLTHWNAWPGSPLTTTSNVGTQRATSPFSSPPGRPSARNGPVSPSEHASRPSSGTPQANLVPPLRSPLVNASPLGNASPLITHQRAQRTTPATSSPAGHPARFGAQSASHLPVSPDPDRPSPVNGYDGASPSPVNGSAPASTHSPGISRLPSLHGSQARPGTETPSTPSPGHPPTISLTPSIKSNPPRP